MLGPKIVKEVEGRGALQRTPAVYFRNVGCKDLSKTPMQVVRSLSHYHPAIVAMPVVVLDHLAPHIFDTYKLSTLPWDHSPKNKTLIVNETLAQYRFRRASRTCPHFGHR